MFNLPVSWNISMCLKGIAQLAKLVLLQKTVSGCPERCDCEVAEERRKVSIDDIEEQQLEAGDVGDTEGEEEGFKVNVFCTDLGLTRFPVSLPPDTVYLNLENNKVSFEIL